MPQPKQQKETEKMSETINIQLEHIASSIEELKEQIKDRDSATQKRLDEGRKTFEEHHDKIQSLEFSRKIQTISAAGLWAVFLIVLSCFLNSYFDSKFKARKGEVVIEKTVGKK